MENGNLWNLNADIHENDVVWKTFVVLHWISVNVKMCSFHQKLYLLLHENLMFKLNWFSSPEMEWLATQFMENIARSI